MSHLQRIKLCLFFVLLMKLSGFAQQPDDKINFSSFNKKYLEHLIKIKIDSVRGLKNLKPLVNDSILYLAACDQAEYITKKKMLGHFQEENPQKKNPQLRAEFYGAVNYQVGENVEVTSVNVPMKNKRGREYTNNTYELLAFDFVDGWVHSPHHYANIITPDYQITGVAVSINPETNEVYAAQVFAKVNFKYDFIENKQMFNYSDYIPPKLTSSFSEVSHDMHKGKHAWGLKAPKNDSLAHCKCYDLFDSSDGVARIRTSGRTIIFYTTKVAAMRDLLQKRKNGLAAEIMAYSPYDCGNPAYYEKPGRRNGQCIFSGTVLKPIYRGKLKRAFKRQHKSQKTFLNITGDVVKTFFSKGKMVDKRATIKKLIRNESSAEYFEVRLGKIPKKMGGFLEYNLVMIRKKEVCRVLHFSDLCGDPYTDNKKIKYVPYFTDGDYEIPPYKFHNDFVIPFEWNKYNYKYQDIKPFIESISKDAITILGLKINAQSSIEGTKAINDELQQKRAESILKAMQSAQKENIAKQITISDGWKMFLKQIQTDRRLEPLRVMNKEQLEKHFEDTAVCNKYEYFLAQQRKADISLDFSKNITRENRRWHVVDNYNRCLDSLKLFNKNKKLEYKIPYYTDTLDKLQHYAYRYYLKGELDEALLFELPVPEGCSCTKLQFNSLWLKDKFNKYNEKFTKQDFYTGLSKILECDAKHGGDPKLRFRAKYNQALFLIDNFEDGSYTSLSADKRFYFVKGIITALSPFVLEDTVFKPYYQQMQLNFYFKTLDHLHGLALTKYTKPIIEYCLGKVFEYYNSHPIDEALALKLGRFFIYYDKNNYALSIMLPFLKHENPNHEMLILFVKMMYQNIQEYPETKYYELVKWAKDHLNNDEWCKMFVGPCNISFQSFDYEPLRMLYCKECAEIGNYATKPVK